MKFADESLCLAKEITQGVAIQKTRDKLFNMDETGLHVNNCP
jgi:hypothetical protein